MSCRCTLRIQINLGKWITSIPHPEEERPKNYLISTVQRMARKREIFAKIVDYLAGIRDVWVRIVFRGSQMRVRGISFIGRRFKNYRTGDVV